MAKVVEKSALVIVESPAKARTINRYLGKGYVVKASLGHVQDLPKNDLAVNVDSDFEPTYAVIDGKKELIDELCKVARKSSAIYLAADPDREGEAICYHLAEVLQSRSKDTLKIYRVLFKEITKKGITQAFKEPGTINFNRVDAQQARRVLDRLVGYKISPLLWDKVRRGLSAGRVQTVALRLVVEREQAIKIFKKKEYWTIEARLRAPLPPQFVARLVRKDGKSVEIGDGNASNAVIEAVGETDWMVESVATKERRRNPVAPFITSTLQQEAARRARFSVKRTMMLAQRLYEGVELGREGAVGLITYMRTDSVRVSDDAIAECRSFIQERYGDAYLPQDANVYKTKKRTQDAHEAVRPTSVERTPNLLRKHLSEDELKVYTLIWNRFVASQMKAAVFDQTSIEIGVKGSDNHRYLFRVSGSVPRFDGFRRVYEEGRDQKDQEDTDLTTKLPAAEKGDKLTLKKLLPEQHFTEPPPRFTEATLVKELEARGVGRPSTYAAILSTLQDREYAKKTRGRFVPTELGTIVTQLLLEAFDDIFDVAYTANLEEELDEIEDGRRNWRESIGAFYDKFSRDLDNAAKTMTDMKKLERPTDLKCDKCDNPMVIRWGRHGSFIACSGYPDCTNTRELTIDLPDVDSSDLSKMEGETEYCPNCGRPMALKRGRFGMFHACTGYPDCKTTRQVEKQDRKADVPLDEKCPQCDSQMVRKAGRFGEFTACSNYPDCRFIKQETIGLACPRAGCEGEIIQRRSKRGRVFYGCVRYPSCDFTAWAKPIDVKCPECGSPYMETKARKSGSFLQCPNGACKHKMSVAEKAS